MLHLNLSMFCVRKTSFSNKMNDNLVNSGAQVMPTILL